MLDSVVINNPFMVHEERGKHNLGHLEQVTIRTEIRVKPFLFNCCGHQIHHHLLVVIAQRLQPRRKHHLVDVQMTGQNLATWQTPFNAGMIKVRVHIVV